MVAILLALGSAAAYGVADFAGGLAARGTHVLRVVAFSAPASLLTELTLWPVIGGVWSAGAVGWGMGAGVASTAAFLLLYRSLALGPMGVLSPVTAVVSAAVPVGVGIAQSEHPSGVAWLGIALALASVVLVSLSPGTSGARVTPTALTLAVGAGAAIAAQLVLLHQSPPDSGIVPLIAGRLVSGTAVLAAVLVRQPRHNGARVSPLLALAAGALDALANLAFLVASRHGTLSTVAVITALYPAGTVVLARVLLGERLANRQWIGLGIAAAATTLLAAA